MSVRVDYLVKFLYKKPFNGSFMFKTNEPTTVDDWCEMWKLKCQKAGIPLSTPLIVIPVFWRRED